jgi:hypothetical protein
LTAGFDRPDHISARADVAILRAGPVANLFDTSNYAVGAANLMGVAVATNVMARLVEVISGQRFDALAQAERLYFFSWNASTT